MSKVEPGVREIRIFDAGDAFRAIYAAKFDRAIFVLHCFQKKSQKTNRKDLSLATRRYKDLMKELSNE